MECSCCAGPEIVQGSSRPQEALLLEARPGLAASVLDVGTVSEAEKAWLYGRSALAIYPSVVEGFGLVPFEAAAHGVPCMWAPGSSLSELLPDAAAEIVPWDAELSAARALALIREADARERNLQAVDAAASDLTWDATAAGMLEVYRTTAEGAANPGLAAAAAGTSALGSLERGCRPSGRSSRRTAARCPSSVARARHPSSPRRTGFRRAKAGIPRFV